MRDVTEQDIQMLCKESQGFLTEGEIQGIMRAYRSSCYDLVVPHVRDILFKVRDFCTPRYLGQQTLLGTWLKLGLDRLRGVESRDGRWFPESVTREALKERLEENAAEDLKDRLEFFEDDPDGYRKFFNLPADHQPGTEHPWGDENLALYRAWLDSTPFTVYTLWREVREAAIERLDEELAEMAMQDSGGTSIASGTRSVFETKLGLIQAQLEKGL